MRNRQGNRLRNIQTVAKNGGFGFWIKAKVVADVYALQGQVGRGGWTWYTGSAGWMYRVWLEEVLGFTLRDGNRLTLAPVIPHDWPGFTLTYRHGSSTYRIRVENPNSVSKGVTAHLCIPNSV